MGRVGETDGADEREDRDRDSVGSREGGLTTFADEEEEDDGEAAPNEEAAVAVVELTSVCLENLGATWD